MTHKVDPGPVVSVITAPLVALAASVLYLDLRSPRPAVRAGAA